MKKGALDEPRYACAAQRAAIFKYSNFNRRLSSVPANLQICKRFNTVTMNYDDGYYCTYLSQLPIEYNVWNATNMHLKTYHIHVKTHLVRDLFLRDFYLHIDELHSSNHPRLIPLHLTCVFDLLQFLVVEE